MQAHLHPRGLAVGLGELQTPVAPAVRGIGITEQGGDLLSYRCLRPGLHWLNSLVLGFPPVDAAGESMAGRELPVEGIGPGHQLQPGQRESVAASQGLLPVALTGPAVFGGQHQHQRGAVPEHQQVRRGEAHPQVRTSAIHIRQYRGQAGRQIQPAAAAEHPRIGPQGVAEEARGAGGFEALAVGRLRLPLTLGEVVLLAAAAVGGGEQGPAVGGDLQ